MALCFTAQTLSYILQLTAFGSIHSSLEHAITQGGSNYLRGSHQLNLDGNLTNALIRNIASPDGGWEGSCRLLW